MNHVPFFCEPPNEVPEEETEWKCPDCGTIFVSRKDGEFGWDWLLWEEAR